MGDYKNTNQNVSRILSTTNKAKMEVNSKATKAKLE
jgi:hypothetical protein